jgi:hypothetical protein
MLSRWEEMLIESDDFAGRIRAGQSLAGRHGFLDRPVVNEYAGYLGGLLKKMGVAVPENKRAFRVSPQHDIDYINLPRQRFRKYLSDIKAFDLPRFFYRLGMSGRPEAHHTLSLLMDMSENNGLTSTFFFTVGGNHPLDCEDYTGTDYFRQSVEEIKKRGHHIALHPSVHTHLDARLLINEKERLEKLTDSEITDSRQHYLAFRVPNTWDVLQASNRTTRWATTMAWGSAVAAATRSACSA